MALAAVRFNALDLLLIIHCLLLFPLLVVVAVRFVLYSFAFISLGKRELVVLLLLSSECHVAVIFL